MADLDEKYIQMTQSPIKRLILRMAGPSMLSNAVTVLYTLTDQFFVGTMGSAATGALGIAFPLMVINQAFGLFFGQGSGNSVSRELGRKNVARAERLVSVGFFCGFCFGVLYAIIGLIFKNQLVFAFGATPDIAPLAQQYLIPLMIVFPFSCCTYVMNPQMRHQGLSSRSMYGIISGVVINAILEPTFIFAFHWGIVGAGAATAVSQVCSFAFMVLLSHKYGTVKTRLRNFKPDVLLIREMAGGGLPSLLQTGVMSLATTCINLAANPFGTFAIAAMSVVSRIVTFTNTLVAGIGQGFQPVCGYNYGAGKFERVRQGYWFVVKLSTGFLIVAVVLQEIFAPYIVAIFQPNPHVVAYATVSLRLQCATLVLSGIIMMSSMTHQTTGKTIPASILGMCRQGLFLVPIVFIMPTFLGFFGVQIAQPISDVCALAMTIPFQRRMLRDLRQGAKITEKATPGRRFVMRMIGRK